MGRKACRRCKAVLAFDQFNLNRSRRDGRQNTCRTCQAGEAAARRASARAFVLRHLLTHPCVDCGETDLAVLDFDHVRGTKVMNVSELVRRRCSIYAVEAEIEKCEVRCANCHRRRTASQQNWHSQTTTHAV